MNGILYCKITQRKHQRNELEIIEILSTLFSSCFIFFFSFRCGRSRLVRYDALSLLERYLFVLTCFDRNPRVYRHTLTYISESHNRNALINPGFPGITFCQEGLIYVVATLASLRRYFGIGAVIFILFIKQNSLFAFFFAIVLGIYKTDFMCYFLNNIICFLIRMHSQFCCISVIYAPSAETKTVNPL